MPIGNTIHSGQFRITRLGKRHWKVVRLCELGDVIFEVHGDLGTVLKHCR